MGISCMFMSMETTTHYGHAAGHCVKAVDCDPKTGDLQHAGEGRRSFFGKSDSNARVEHVHDKVTEVEKLTEER